MRKAVSKKNKDAIINSVKNLSWAQKKQASFRKMPPSKCLTTLNFLRVYGFNKSHAAVYAVLTCQTAYLKAHYPLEYMTALLCTDIGNTEKVAMFIAEARHLGIQVLTA